MLFYPNNTELPFVPSARPGGRIEGLAPASRPCHPERSEVSDLTRSETARRALARMLDPPDALAKFFAFGELLLATAPKVTKRAAPGVCAGPSQKKKRDGPVPCAPQPERGPSTGHPWPDDGRFGILPRPAPNRRGPTSLRLCGARRKQRGERQKPKQSNIKSTAPTSTCVILAQAGIQF